MEFNRKFTMFKQLFKVCNYMLTKTADEVKACILDEVLRSV